MRKLVLLLVVAAVVGGGAWLATQPSGDLPAVQPSSTAALAAKAKVAAAFGRAAAAAFLTGRQQTFRVELSDEELTSLAAENGSGPVSNPVIHGTADGVFQASGDALWNGVTLHVSGSGTVSIDSAGSVHPVIRSAGVGLLPLPTSIVQSLADQAAASAASVPMLPGVANLALQPVDGGGVLSGTAAPAR